MELLKIKSYLSEKEKKERLLKEQERDAIIVKLVGLESVWEKYKIKKIYLYGSFVDLTFCKYSDVDLAVESEMEYDVFLKLSSEVDRGFGREVDLRLINELPFAQQVREKGLLIYERKNSDPQE